MGSNDINLDVLCQICHVGRSWLLKLMDAATMLRGHREPIIHCASQIASTSSSTVFHNTVRGCQ